MLPGPCPTGRTNTRIKGWMGRADQTTKVRGMFVHPKQVDEIVKRFPEVGRARLVVSGEMANDAMTLRVETDSNADGFARACGRSYPGRDQAARRSGVRTRQAVCPTTARLLKTPAATNERCPQNAALVRYALGSFRDSPNHRGSLH